MQANTEGSHCALPGQSPCLSRAAEPTLCSPSHHHEILPRPAERQAACFVTLLVYNKGGYKQICIIIKDMMILPVLCQQRLLCCNGRDKSAFLDGARAAGCTIALGVPHCFPWDLLKQAAQQQIEQQEGITSLPPVNCSTIQPCKL